MTAFDRLLTALYCWEQRHPDRPGDGEGFQSANGAALGA